MVGKGKYYNPFSGTLAEMESADKLPGNGEERFFKVNTATMVIIAPVATLLFVVLLPVAYVASFTTLWGYKLLRLLLGMGHTPALRH